ncbi:asparaginase [Devosia sp. 1566]|uniref:asparaginase n=1 Tax=Devosia sp. 1566 TaxID=2499144 RepID=UPI0020C14D2A|nr:asparaginase [Devosia sp. 1566]
MMPITFKPRVHVIVLGGTITMMPRPEGGIVPALEGADLIRAVPGLDRVAEVSVETPFLVPGASLTFDNLLEVVRRAEAALAAGAIGVVIAQGTDTIDETAFLLDLAHEGQAPVVVTGAMRGADAPGADGPANLLAAVLVAASEAARGLGALVVLNDEIHAARFVEKGHKALPSAFISPSAAAVGLVAEGEVHIAFRPARLPHLNGIPQLARVAIVKLALGDDGDLVRAASDLGYAGIVVEAMGAGHVPGAAVPALAQAAGRMPVVLASRVPGGAIFQQTYGFPGSERDLLGHGLVAGGTLSPPKARLLLAALIGQGGEPMKIAERFRLYR